MATQRYSHETRFSQLVEPVDGSITEERALRENLAENCLAASLLAENVPDYDTVLAARRRLMALETVQWFEVLS